MTRYFSLLAAFGLLLSIDSLSFAQSPQADKAITESIASLRMHLATAKKVPERNKLNKAIAALESVLSGTPSKASTADKVTRENYDKIKNLMELAEVQKILGPGRETSRAGRSIWMRWTGKRTGKGLPVEIEINFQVEARVPGVSYPNPPSISVQSKSIRGDD